MTLQMAVHNDYYSFTEDVSVLDVKTIEKSKARFEQLKKEHVILSGNYNDRRWIMSNEVAKNVSISFQINELHFANETQKKLGCTLYDYHEAMRVVITSRFSFALETLQNDVRIMRQFADHFTVPKDYASAQLLADLIVLLPGNSAYRQEVLNQIDDVPRLVIEAGKQRRLAHYQSYLKLRDIIDRFWETATIEEKKKYFPVWFWFKVTGVLPLRPTECVLTPRRCIKKDKDSYFITVRRTKLKGMKQASRYRIESDYELCEYPIPEKLALPILEYIDNTSSMYQTDIDVLFCKSTQFTIYDAELVNDHHYTYSNLRQCLFHFYSNIVHKKMGFRIVADTERLMENEIEMVKLGDARHIAMIGLIISGGSPTICKELANHASMSTSAHYYSNLTEFLDVLGYERFHEMIAPTSKAYGISVSQNFPVENGYCQCPAVWTGDFTPCESAVNSSGLPGCCPVCQWFFPTRGSILKGDSKTEISYELEQTCMLLKQSLELLTQQLGNIDTLSAILDKLAAQAAHYVNATAVDRILKEDEVTLYG